MATDLSQTVSLEEIAGIAPQLYTEPVDPRRAALIIVDMQGHLTTSTHPVEVRAGELRAALSGCEKLLLAARESDIRVVHILLGSWTMDGSDLSDNKQRANKLYTAQGRDPVAERAWDSPDTHVMPPLAPIKGEIALKKTSASAFTTTGLCSILHNMQVRYTVFAGQFTEGCLGLTALDACDHGFAVTLADDACYGASRAGHLVMLRMFDQHWGRVRTVAELTRELRGKP